MKTKVAVFVGPGGVGKTTLAAAAALKAAQEGKKVLVLTIDPSQRLASTLGVQGAKEPVRVPGFQGKGELWASVVDHQSTFDEFVRKAAAKAPAAEKLLQNRLYRQLTTNLAGSQDFSALEKLYSVVTESDYDLVVLDTPPAQHALTFLRAPEKIAALFDEGVAKWLREPGTSRGCVQRMLGAGTRQVLKVLESLTGAEFIRELGEFFRALEGWQDRLRERTGAVHKMLVSDLTEFSLVTSFDPAKLKESERFARDIRREGYHLRQVLVNRAFPEWLQQQSSPPNSANLRPVFDKFREFYELRQTQLDRFSAGLKGEVEVLRLPELNERVSDLKGLERVAIMLKEGGLK